jgi:hypothetical protein
MPVHVKSGDVHEKVLCLVLIPCPSLDACSSREQHPSAAWQMVTAVEAHGMLQDTCVVEVELLQRRQTAQHNREGPKRVEGKTQHSQ